MIFFYVTSAIFLLDQKIDAVEFLERISVIALYFYSLSNTEIKAIKKWSKNTVVDPLDESAKNVLEKGTFLKFFKTLSK